MQYFAHSKISCLQIIKKVESDENIISPKYAFDDMDCVKSAKYSKNCRKQALYLFIGKDDTRW